MKNWSMMKHQPVVQHGSLVLHQCMVQHWAMKNCYRVKHESMVLHVFVVLHQSTMKRSPWYSRGLWHSTRIPSPVPVPSAASAWGPALVRDEMVHDGASVCDAALEDNEASLCSATLMHEGAALLLITPNSLPSQASMGWRGRQVRAPRLKETPQPSPHQPSARPRRTLSAQHPP